MVICTHRDLPEGAFPFLGQMPFPLFPEVHFGSLGLSVGLLKVGEVGLVIFGPCSHRLIVLRVDTLIVDLLLGLGLTYYDLLALDAVTFDLENLVEAFHCLKNDKTKPLKFKIGLPLVFPVFESLTT